MARLSFVRHGQAAASWGADKDPGLSALGKAQAVAVGAELATEIFNNKIVSSPLLRCQETAAPLAASWGVTIAIAPAVSEIPTSKALAGKDLDARAQWLRSLMGKRWSDLAGEKDLLRWKAELLTWCAAQKKDAVVFSHFIAVNVLLSAAGGQDDFLVAQPDYCSVWVFESGASGDLRLVRAGAVLKTKIL